jgi:chemotaxis methyl-accepting protein methylase
MNLATPSRGSSSNLQHLLAIRDLVSDEAGLHFGESRLHLLENCIKKRMAIAGFQSDSEYYTYLVSGNLAKRELTELLSIATTQETSFMRIPEHFQALREEELPRLVKLRQAKNENYLHIWSAGTATGEEAYSLAITTLTSGIREEIKPMIIGTDIDPLALMKAREGKFKAGRLKNLSPAMVWSHFDRDGELYKVKDNIKNTVTFFSHNLVSDHQIFDQDIIFCRNVTIYFSHQTRAGVLSKLVECLKPGGIIMLGEAEIMPSQITGLEPRSYRSSLYYVKAGGAR